MEPSGSPPAVAFVSSKAGSVALIDGWTLRLICNPAWAAQSRNPSGSGKADGSQPQPFHEQFASAGAPTSVLKIGQPIGLGRRLKSVSIEKVSSGTPRAANSATSSRMLSAVYGQ